MPPKYPNWLEVNLSAVEHNTREVRQRTNTALMAVVKANAYGMGAIEVSKAVLSVGAEYLAVARGCEVLALRQGWYSDPNLAVWGSS